MLAKKKQEILEIVVDDVIGENNEELANLTTRFLRERENRLDRQTLRLAQTLIGAGFKVTEPRLAVLEEIVRIGREFEIHELNERLEKRPDANLGIASIFRTIKLLTELGLLQRVHTTHSTGDSCQKHKHSYSHKYRLVSGHNHQVICRCCNRTVEFHGCDFGDLTAFLEKQTGFRLEGHSLEFFGLCSDCREAALEKPQMVGILPIVPLAPHEHAGLESQEKPESLDVREVSQIP